MGKLESVMFCANDPDGHTVRWGHVANAWLVENKNGLVADCSQLCTALTTMHYTADNRALPFDEYRMIPPKQWTIKDNPGIGG